MGGDQDQVLLSQEITWLLVSVDWSTWSVSQRRVALSPESLTVTLPSAIGPSQELDESETCVIVSPGVGHPSTL